MQYEPQNISWPGWETVRLIGRGSFGAVYEIRRTVGTHTSYAALKVISIPGDESEISEMRSEGYANEDLTRYYADNRESIENEYALMADLRGHSNIVYCDDIRTIQQDNGFGWDIFIKMELLTPLKNYLPDDISEETVINLGKDLCNALVLCKKHNIIHRDIKPANIFVSRDGNFKLGDFGIARMAEGTRFGTIIGTYEYMAPEVYNSKPYNYQADIYSLGMVMYWLLNDRCAPFSPKRPSSRQRADARERRFSGEPIPAPKNGSKRLQAIVLKACAYDPNDRYSSAEEMLQDLNMLSGVPQDIPSPVSQPTPPASNNTPDSGNDKPRQKICDVVTPVQEPAEKKQPAPVPAASETAPEKPINGVFGNLIPTPVQEPKVEDRCNAEAENPQRVLQQQQEEQSRLAQQQKEAQEPLAQQNKQEKKQAGPALKQKRPPAAHQRWSITPPKNVNSVYDNLSPAPAQEPTAQAENPQRMLQQQRKELQVPSQDKPSSNFKLQRIPKKVLVPCVLVIAAILIALVVFAMPGKAQNTVTASGSFNNNISWSLTSNGILTISGSGALTASSYPWADYSGKIKAVNITSGITLIGPYAFDSCSRLKTVIIPKSVKNIGNNAFHKCNKLSDIYYGGTANDWSRIYIYDGKAALNGAEIHYIP